MATHTHPATDSELLPQNLDAERFVLGAVLSDPTAFAKVGSELTAEDFSVEKHRRIFLRMFELYERGESIDRVTVTNELMRVGQLQSIGGLSYLVSLDDGMPQLHNISGYVGIVKQKSTARRLALVMRDAYQRTVADTEDPNDLIASTSRALMSLSELRGIHALFTPRRIVEEYEGGYESFLNPSRRKPGIQTGFIKFDEMTGGLREGELTILAARPAMGKSSLALNIAQHVAMNPRNPLPVALFSLEMSKESLLTRMVCSAARVDQQRFRAGYLNQAERAALSDSLQEIVDAPLYFDDSPAANLMTMEVKLRRLQAEVGLGFVVVDYLQLMQGRGRAENRVQEISSLSRGFKLLAKSLKIPFLVLSQLSRAPETRQGDHRPILSDLRDSGSIEQDADIVAFIFREEVYRPDKESLRGVAELILAKQRNGPIGRTKLVFLHRYTKFENMAFESGEGEGSFE